MQICGMVDPSKHYFVDDSLLNCKGAKAVGWNVWLFDEDSTHTVEPGAVNGTIRSLEGELVPSVQRLARALASRSSGCHTIQSFENSGCNSSRHERSGTTAASTSQRPGNRSCYSTYVAAPVSAIESLQSASDYVKPRIVEYLALFFVTERNLAIFPVFVKVLHSAVGTREGHVASA